MFLFDKLISGDQAIEEVIALANRQAVANNARREAFAQTHGFRFHPELRQLFDESHKLRSWRGRTTEAEITRVADLAAANKRIENFFNRHSHDSNIDINDLVGAAMYFIVVVANPDYAADAFTTRFVAHTLSPRVKQDRARLSGDLQVFADTTLTKLAKEYEELLDLLTASSSETQEWKHNLKKEYLDNSNNVLNYCIARIIELSSAIADFIREKNIQEEKEKKLLEKLREELTGFVLPAGLRQAIAQKLGINPEYLDPAVARREAEEVSAA
jgi:hypothetical protein